MQTANDDMVGNPAIIYEDSDILVIDKPVGMLVHPDGHATDKTVVDWFLERVPEACGVGEVGYAPNGELLERSGVVHRLDRDTSGVLVLAKTAEAHQFLKQQFKDRLVHKEYRALVYGRVNDHWGTINRPIGRHATDHRRYSAEPGSKGVRRPALTDYERIAVGEYEGESFSYLKLIPKTGRTHQLRVHLRAIDRPIVGDTLYAAHKLDVSHNLGLTRLALHAHVLEFTLLSGETQRFLGPVPTALEQAVDCLAEG